jgi:peptidoglycan/LPS O-acetylase OafA/YrhL
MNNRLHEIDGIRGWAALAVLMFHLTAELFGGLFPDYRLVYFKFFIDGPLAVFVFFILSGDALSSGYLRSNNARTLVRLVLKRYFRLAGPILLSCLLVYALMKCNMVFNAEASRIVDGSDWLGRFIQFDASLMRTVRYALSQVFTDTNRDISYNPFLWPMSIELFGSFFLFGLLFSLKFTRRPLLIISLAAVYFFILGSYYSLFFIGLAFSMLRERGHFANNRASPKSAWSFFACIGIVAIDGVLEKNHATFPQCSILMAVVLVYAIYSNSRLTAFFCNGVSRYLGRISFPLYITHFSVIVSVASWEIIYFHTRGLLDFYHSGIVVISCAALACLLAEIFARLESFYLKKLDLVVASLLVDPNFNAHPQDARVSLKIDCS